MKLMTVRQQTRLHRAEGRKRGPAAQRWGSDPRWREDPR